MACVGVVLDGVLGLEHSQLYIDLKIQLDDLGGGGRC